MQLSITDRVTILGLLPKEGNIDTLKALRKFKESLSLTEEEKSTIKWRLEYKCPKCNESIYLPTPAKCGTCDVWLEPTGAAQWETASDPNKEVFMSSTIMGIVSSTLAKMNEKGKLTEELVPLFEKFYPSG